MRFVKAMGKAALIAGLSAAAACQSVDREPDTGPLLRASDHVLVWSQDAGAAERIFEQLGFNVRKGQIYPEGITSSTVVFGDWSYLELLHYSDPSKATGNAQAEAELAFALQAPGANSMAIQVSDIEASAALLEARGFPVSEVTPDSVDPDGPGGPAAPVPASWRDFHFADTPVAGVELFFIAYPPDPPPTPESETKFRVRTSHANTARSLSAIWVLVPDLEAEAVTYRRMGFDVGPAIVVPHLNGRARVAQLGSGAVVIVQSEAFPEAFRVPGRDGARIIGVSVETESLAVARAALEGQHAYAVRDAIGPFGLSVLAQTSDALGMFVMFHE